MHAGVQQLLSGPGGYAVQGEALPYQVQRPSGIPDCAVAVGLGQQQHRSELILVLGTGAVHGVGGPFPGRARQFRDRHRQQHLSFPGQLRVDRFVVRFVAQALSAVDLAWFVPVARRDGAVCDHRLGSQFDEQVADRPQIRALPLGDRLHRRGSRDHQTAEVGA